MSVETGSTCARSSRQARSFSSDVSAAAGIGGVPNVPITATPTEPVLKPRAYAPITFLSMPP